MTVFNTPLSLDGHYDYDADALRDAWPRLHGFHDEPFPSADWLQRQWRERPCVINGMDGDFDWLSSQLLDAWRHFHRGDFRTAFESGRRLGPPGQVIAQLSACVQADNVTLSKDIAKALFSECAAASLEASKHWPDHVNSMFYHGLHLGRYSETVSLLKAAAENIAPRFVQALEHTLARHPRHVLALIGFGAYHASVVAAAGSLVAKLTYGASREKAVGYFESGIACAPHLPATHLEFGKGLALLKDKNAAKHFERGASLAAMDAMEELDIRQCRRALR